MKYHWYALIVMVYSALTILPITLRVNFQSFEKTLGCMVGYLICAILAPCIMSYEVKNKGVLKFYKNMFMRKELFFYSSIIVTLGILGLLFKWAALFFFIVPFFIFWVFLFYKVQASLPEDERMYIVKREMTPRYKLFMKVVVGVFIISSCTFGYFAYKIYSFDALRYSPYRYDDCSLMEMYEFASNRPFLAQESHVYYKLQFGHPIFDFTNARFTSLEEVRAAIPDSQRPAIAFYGFDCAFIFTDSSQDKSLFLPYNRITAHFLRSKSLSLDSIKDMIYIYDVFDL